MEKINTELLENLVMQKMLLMAQESLSPDYYESYVTIHNQLITTRKLQILQVLD